jgi:hypothetical protein
MVLMVVHEYQKCLAALWLEVSSRMQFSGACMPRLGEMSVHSAAIRRKGQKDKHGTTSSSHKPPKELRAISATVNKKRLPSLYFTFL